MKKCSPSTSHENGLRAEDLALHYLIDKNYIFIAQRYKKAGGEIDLIMHKNDTLVMIEVKFRKIIYNAAESVTKLKRHRIIQTAQKFMMENQDFIKQFPYMRFDVILLNHKDEIHHIKNAFGETE
jgi:putative endonuclease